MKTQLDGTGSGPFSLRLNLALVDQHRSGHLNYILPHDVWVKIFAFHVDFISQFIYAKIRQGNHWSSNGGVDCDLYNKRHHLDRMARSWWSQEIALEDISHWI